jgi:hypothetical protein
MEDKPKDETTQQTPTGHTIPVPSREQVLRDFETVAKAKPSRRRLRGPKDQ